MTEGWQAERRELIDEQVQRISEAVGASHSLRPGELVVAWVLLAATRDPDGGGQVIRMLSDPTMPPWQVKGILGDAQDDVCNDQYSPAPEDDE